MLTSLHQFTLHCPQGLTELVEVLVQQDGVANVVAAVRDAAAGLLKSAVDSMNASMVSSASGPISCAFCAGLLSACGRHMDS